MRKGWSEGYRSTGTGYTTIDTPKGFEARNEALIIWCAGTTEVRCGKSMEMDMPAMIARGWGDVPVDVLVDRMRCTKCGRWALHMNRTGRPRNATAGGLTPDV